MVTYPNKGPITLGSKTNGENFYTKLVFTNTTYNTDADIIIPFTTYSVNFLLEAGGPVEYSFSSFDTHGDMILSLPSRERLFENRAICKVWFRVPSGASSTVRIEAWAIR